MVMIWMCAFVGNRSCIRVKFACTFDRCRLDAQSYYVVVVERKTLARSIKVLLNVEPGNRNE